MSAFRLSSAAIIAVALSACNGGGTKPADDQNGFVPCSEPRPEMCTLEYTPVCGRFSEGGAATYSNACNACADPNIEAYRAGACEP